MNRIMASLQKFTAHCSVTTEEQMYGDWLSIPLSGGAHGRFHRVNEDNTTEFREESHK